MKLSFRTLCTLGWHIGHVKEKTPFLATWLVKGFIKLNNNLPNYYLLNISQLIFRLNFLLKFLIKKSYQKGEFLFLITNRIFSKYIIKYSILINSHYYVGIWLNGLLANWKSIRLYYDKLRKLVFKNYKIFAKQLKIYFKLQGINFLNNLPDLIFLYNWVESKSIVIEANTVKIPILILLDNNESTFGILRNLQGNNESLLCLNFYLYMKSKQILLGKVFYILKWLYNIRKITRKKNIKLLNFFNMFSNDIYNIDLVTYINSNSNMVYYTKYNKTEVEGLLLIKTL